MLCDNWPGFLFLSWDSLQASIKLFSGYADKALQLIKLNYHSGFWDACIANEIQFDGIGVLWNQHVLDEWITYETENGGMEF